MIDSLLASLRERAARHRQATGRPLVTLSYAQSLDGSLSLRRGERSPVSGPESLVITHRLRAVHHAILVGIGTVLADDPSLRVRLADGPHPQPIVLDSRLRFPLDARLLTLGREPWVATLDPPDDVRRAALEAAGARVLLIPPTADRRINLPALLDTLAARGVDSVMVEGGAELITSVLREQLADLAVLTVAPVLAGGYASVGDLGVSAWERLPRLVEVEVERAGEDIMVSGHFEGGGAP